MSVCVAKYKEKKIHVHFWISSLLLTRCILVPLIHLKCWFDSVQLFTNNCELCQIWISFAESWLAFPHQAFMKRIPGQPRQSRPLSQQSNFWNLETIIARVDFCATVCAGNLPHQNKDHPWSPREASASPFKSILRNTRGTLKKKTLLQSSLP